MYYNLIKYIQNIDYNKQHSQQGRSDICLMFQRNRKDKMYENKTYLPFPVNIKHSYINIFIHTVLSAI